MGLTYEGQFEFPNKKFYYCVSSDYTFKEMPDLNDQHKDFVNKESSYFQGDPLFKLKVVEQPVADDEAEPNPDAENEGKANSDDSSVGEIQAPPKDLSEADRLRYVVQAIENDCQVVPVGSFKMTAQHQVRRNEAYKGLPEKDSGNINQYLHFRNVQTEEKKKALDEPNAPFNTNFLESIAEDQPKGCWNLQSDMVSTNVLGRSLLWPGYHFYSNSYTGKFGGVYIGDGLKNLELQFMTQ